MLVAVGLGWAWFRHAEQLTSANTQPATLLNPPLTQELPLQPPVKPGATPQVTGIRHWSSTDSSTVVVDLEDQTQYEAHTLDNPPRVYFDLHDTKMAPGLLNQSILVDDASAFQTIIVDLPPILAAESFVLPWAGLLDDVVVVLREFATPVPVLRQALSRLGSPSPRVVLNRAVTPAFVRPVSIQAARA